MKKVRLTRAMTLLEVAEKLGKTEATIQRYESGNIKNLKSDVIESLAGILGTSPAYLMGWIDDEPESTDLYNYYPVTIPIELPTSIDDIPSSDVDKINLPNVVMGKYAGSKDIYITKINTDSMNKIVPLNSLIVVKYAGINDLTDDVIVIDTQ